MTEPIWKPTAELRWLDVPLVELAHGVASSRQLKLQQKWLAWVHYAVSVGHYPDGVARVKLCETGEFEWRDVPTVMDAV